jgi:outer membrane protein insertion porin family
MKNSVNISAVRVEGAVHTRKSFLASFFSLNPAMTRIPSPIPPSVPQPNALEDVLHATRHRSNILQNTDIFKSIEAHHLERQCDPLARLGDVDRQSSYF